MRRYSIIQVSTHLPADVSENVHMKEKEKWTKYENYNSLNKFACKTRRKFV